LGVPSNAESFVTLAPAESELRNVSVAVLLDIFSKVIIGLSTEASPKEEK
jgi:hypothetical protein